MPNSHSTLTSLFSDIANAIRAKTGNSGTIVADNFPSAIAAITTGSSGPSITGYASFEKQVDLLGAQSGSKSVTYTVTRNSSALYYVLCFSAMAHIYVVDDADTPTSGNAASPAGLCFAAIVLDTDGNVIGRFGDNTSTAKLERTVTSSNSFSVKATYRAMAGMYVTTSFYGGYLIGS